MHTPIENFESYLGSEKGKNALSTLRTFIPPMEEEFQRVKKAVPVTLTEEARKRYMDFDIVGQELKKHLMYSGLMIDFAWEEWTEGLEIVQGIRKMPDISPFKILKLLSVIMYMEKANNGFLDDSIKNGMVLKMLTGL
ncbi:DUF6508 domain-containing protein [Aquiflexum balticum]|uniref:DUF6508 domain-containing protein n=1 Tax=Aquiflexum balticum TaxID=280473 RepID=UPI0012F99A79|nr:DUF6508 domain-containing protein [Aquiflexum balticum]